MSTTKWYTLRVKGGREEKIKKAIENTITQANLTPYFKEIITPCEKIYTKHKNKKLIKKRYLSYLFISVDLDTNKNMKQVLSQVEGVYGFLGLSGWGDKQEPIPVSPQEIDLMLGKVQQDNLKGPIEQNFVEGQKVKIISGPFENTIGTIKAINKDQKLKVIIKIFKQNLTEIELSHTQIKKIE